MIQIYFVENILLNELRYRGDNSFLDSISTYLGIINRPRCRFIASWSCSWFQGLVCSTIKAVRELGLERRESVWLLSFKNDLDN